MKTGAGIRGAALAGAIFCLAAPAAAQPGPGFEIVSNGPQLELRFHGVPLKSVRADDNQNALALDFNAPVDPAVFDRLNSALPGWIAMAYSSYDNGVIRASRPVTFLSRPEVDGFSLRLEPRGAVAQAAPFQPAPYGAPPPPPPQPYPPPPQQPYPPQAAPPPPAQPPIPFAPYESYAAARNYYGLRYAVNRGEPLWDAAYAGAAMRADSGVGLGAEYRSFHNGDRVTTGHGSFRVALGAGVALLGSIYDGDASGKNVRTATGTIAATTTPNVLSGAAGIGLGMGGDSEVRLEGLIGAGTGGARLTGWQGNPDGFFSASLIYHAADLDTPEALLDKGIKDEASLSVAQRLGYGLWGSLKARFDNYGLSGHHNMVQTAGWNANLTWNAEVVPNLFAGIAYDGQGEYRLRYTTLTGTAPTPYVPLSIRNLETHTATASLSAALWDQLWLDAFGGYSYDRYAKSGGGIYGGSIRITPAPGLEIELGARHSNISLLQGELGGDTTAGVSLSLGFGGAPRANRFALW
ncbi:MAG: hypothetical protein JO256_00740 [Alphaproteobacteria bacterium]|nr:hypothetical protein [Alphaproteobacteria bacterium]